MYGDRGYGERRSGGFSGNRGGGFSNRQNFVPVNVGDEIDVKIEAVGEKGDGVAKVKGFVLFVPNVKEGELVRIRVTKILRKVGFAESIGPAQGPVSEDSKPAPKPKKEEEDTAQFAGDDSEDFGDVEEEK
ncbi:TRAM domain-containing protein [Candidatus Woesearchaeota archaeon]|nr:TRAM domain-containing protein [Candidatus Woesearchaeota archaeon]